MSHRYVGPVGFSHAGDKDRARQLDGLARLLAQRAIEKIDARGGSGNQMEFQQLPDGSTVRVNVLGAIRPPIVRAYIISPDGKREVEIPITLPDYDCGAVTAPVITEKRIEAEGEEVTIRIVENIIQTDQGRVYAPNETAAKQRQAIDLDSVFATFADFKAMVDGVEFSQHRRIRPGNYTGYMRELVQLLLGVGRLARPTYEDRMKKAGLLRPLSLTKKERKEAGDPFGLWGKDQPLAAQVRYDYRFDRTHGLTWNAAGQCFVLQISRWGVFAYPLEVDPLSEQFRTRYKQLYPELFREDISGLGLFDLLGGFPLGTSPPLIPEIRARVNAGDLIELLSVEAMAPFYAKGAFYSNCGWAFSPLQRMAVNTCWDWLKGIKQGHLFGLDWTIGAWTEPQASPLAGQIRALLPAGGKPWHTRKAGRLDAGQAEQVLSMLTARGRDTSAAWAASFYAAYDDIKVAPSCVGTATLHNMQSGLLYHPSRYAAKGDKCFMPAGHPQFKMPEEVLGYQCSFDFEPAEWGRTPTPERASGPLWACWVGEQLMVVSYSWEREQSTPIPPINTQEPCQIIGTWVTTTPSSTSPRGSFYSNFFDLRRTVRTGGATTRKTTGRFAGTNDYYLFLAFFGNCCAITRNVFTTQEVEYEEDGGGNWRDSLAVPFGDRSIIYSATLVEARGQRSTFSFSAPTFRGTTGFTRWGYVYEWVCHWAGSCPSGKTREGGPSNLCILQELRPMDVVETCLSAYGPPDFPYYQPCDDDPFCRAWRWKECGPLHCIFSASFNSSVQESEPYSTATPVTNRFDWNVKIWGDTHVHGRDVMKGSLSEIGAERFDTPLTEWWWVSSPVCDPPMSCRFDVGVNRLGRSLINYPDQVEQWNTFHAGAPDSLYTGPQAVFYGYVSDEVREHG